MPLPASIADYLRANANELATETEKVASFERDVQASFRQTHEYQR